MAELKDFRLKPIVHRYDAKDSMLYALGLGYGDDPTDPRQVQFVYEQGLKSVPSICVVLAHPGFWINTPNLEIDWVKVLHGEQAFTLHSPLPAEGVVRGEYDVVAVEDKGPKGAVMHVTKRLYDDESDALLSEVTSVYMLRGDGGCGDYGTVPTPPQPLPDRDPDMTVEISTLPQSALIYRLSGDRNPIHADPEAARKAGFDRPILHGLCSMGIATRAIIDAVADGDPDRLKALSLRFSKPVYPGETLQISIFRDGADYRFSARAMERDLVVLDRGTAVLNN
nr:MaoC/PaaZ C-terminal domain-containing protein [Aurantiacibacter rhizosphaerae]